MIESERDEALRLAEEAGFRIEKPGKHSTTQWEPFIDMDGMCTEECIKLISLSRQRPGWKWVKDEIVANTRRDENGLKWCDLFFEGGYRLPADTPLYAAAPKPEDADG